MEKIALITDSAGDLGKEILDKYNIHVLPFKIIYKTREFSDGVDITPEEVYDKIDEEMPTSSLPALIDMEDLYEKLKKEGYTHVIAVTLSSGLSGIFNALRLISDNYPEIKSFIFDSRSISLGEGVLIQKCGEMLEAGKTFEEIIKQLPLLRSRMKVFFVVGTLKYLRRGGRIGRITGAIGEMLNLKPIVTIADDGKYVTYDKLRGRKQSLRRLEEIVYSLEKPGEVFLMHGRAEEEMRALGENLKKYKNVKSLYIGQNISPVSGVHSGPGLVGVVYLEEE